MYTKGRWKLNRNPTFTCLLVFFFIWPVIHFVIAYTTIIMNATNAPIHCIIHTNRVNLTALFNLSIAFFRSSIQASLQLLGGLHLRIVLPFQRCDKFCQRTNYSILLLRNQYLCKVSCNTIVQILVVSLCIFSTFVVQVLTTSLCIF